MRALFLSPSLGIGGSERLVLRYATALRARGHETGIAHGTQRGVTNDLADVARAAGIHVMHVADLPLEARTVPRWAAGLRRASREFAPDVFHAQSVTAALAARVARPRMPLVVTVHGLVLADRERLAAALLSLLRGRLTAVSRATADSVAQHWPHPRIEALPVGIDVAELDRAAAVEAISRFGQPAFCCVARHEPIKGVDVLIEAFATVLQQLPEAGLTLVGAGSAFDGHVELARQLGVSESLRFAGAVPGAEPWIAQADVAVLPSRREGLPVAALEAIGLGRPLVASAVGGTPGVVRPGETGWLVPPEDPAALAAVLIEAGSDLAEARRRGEAGRALIQREYPSEAVFDRLEDEFTQALSLPDR